MAKLSRSPDRGTFQIESTIKRAMDKGLDPNTDIDTQSIIELYENWKIKDIELEQSEEWKAYNLEYDLRTSDWILEKVRNDECYAQNLYAAMCNTDFVKNDVWPILTGKTWFCSWRSAGGIIANMREKGDYIDWYCSGIRYQIDDEEFRNLSKEDQEIYMKTKNKYVSEGTITDEIRADLLKLGWIVKEYESEN